MHHWQLHLREHPKATDGVIVLALVTLSFPGVPLSLDGQGAPESAQLPGWLIMGLACAALLWHRRRPRLTAVVTIGCTMAMSALGFVLTPLLLAPLMLALFMVALHTGLRTGYTCTATAILLVAGAALASGPTSNSFEMSVFGPGLWLIVPAALGGEAHTRLAYMDAVRARAEHAERTRDEEARHRVAEERMRIARELHDVVAHHLALANAQATTVTHLMDRQPGKARTIAGELGATINSALRELKATVGLLRQPDDPAPLEPAPGLGQLADLTAAFTAAGRTVTVVTTGSRCPLAAGIDLTAFRIVQEALTNVVKHAPDSAATVRLDYTPQTLRITVTNTAARNPTITGTHGYGLIGMRERATSVGGRLQAGPRHGGGFEITAELPVVHPDSDEDRKL